MERFRQTQLRMREAQKQLQPWVIRHLKPRTLSSEHSSVARRRRCVGRTILPGHEDGEEIGLEVGGEALLPFLLAARASSHAPDSRPLFAEGLASSFEAFLHTRKAAAGNGDSASGAHASVDGDDAITESIEVNDAANWYLDKLEQLIPRDAKAEASHPKVDATVERVAQLWKCGEKVVVFCHYIATGRILRQCISQRIQQEISSLGASKLSCEPSVVPAQLDRLGSRFFDAESPVRQACDTQARQLLAEFPQLAEYYDTLVEVIRRNLRTPSFLARFFPLAGGRLDESAVNEAFEAKDFSGMTLRRIVRQFLHFLQERCGAHERERYIKAVKRIQTGAHFGVDVGKEYEDDELQDAQPEHLLPNVRLVNGTTRSDTRQRLMLTFNTPFYPEILIASSVMAEGVDLHLNCRYILHHDLCWNPSTLEQRTGRVDRIGAKAEHAEQPIHVYLPFIAETQDEKMYRVVMDRERWFNVVMGEDYKIDARTTEKLAGRIPFPESAANELAFQLGLDEERPSMQMFHSCR
jgi:ERCC4-related helicase